MKLFLLSAGLYFVWSLILSAYRLKRYANFENDMNYTPIGDLAYFEPPVLIDAWSFIFLPSAIMTVVWIFIARLVNNRR